MKHFQRLRDLETKATPAPWTWRVPNYIANKYIDEGLVVDGEEGGLRNEDAAMITEMRNSLPRLLEAVDLMDYVLKDAAQFLTWIGEDSNNWRDTEVGSASRSKKKDLVKALTRLRELGGGE